MLSQSLKAVIGLRWQASHTALLAIQQGSNSLCKALGPSEPLLPLMGHVAGAAGG